MTHPIIRYAGQTGLLAPCTQIAPIIHRGMRCTIPAREALAAAGATITPVGQAVGGWTLYDIQLGQMMPQGIICAQVGQHAALRLQSEPAYPGEVRIYWGQVDWMPCPKCGAPLVWYEAGYVPGYRICTGPRHHHCQAQC